MADKTIERLEKLAAWHRASAERAGSAWVWEARLPPPRISNEGPPPLVRGGCNPVKMLVVGRRH